MDNILFLCNNVLAADKETQNFKKHDYIGYIIVRAHSHYC